MAKIKRFETRRLVLLALLTAIVIILQLLSVLLPVYPFRLALVLVPIVVGAALIGPLAGLWLGAVFGFMVLVSSPDVPVFMMYSPLATILVILLRGLLSGFFAGVTYRLLEKQGKTLAVLCAAVVCPVINTGIFILGLLLFFSPIVGNVIDFFIAFVLVNFLIELIINIVLSSSVVRLVRYGQQRRE